MTKVTGIKREKIKLSKSAVLFVFIYSVVNSQVNFNEIRAGFKKQNS
jgi:hypothetical protein